MMHHILLDIDGVMVPIRNGERPTHLTDGFMAFDPHCADALQWLLKMTRAKIVLTSTHRINYSEESWKSLFLNRGFEIPHLTKVNDADAIQKVGPRSLEIAAWASSQPAVCSYVIIDDDAILYDLPAHFQKRWVRPTSFRGLTLEDAGLALRILEGKV